MQLDLKKIPKTVENLYQEKYPEAEVIFLAGSVMRGEATSTSAFDSAYRAGNPHSIVSLASDLLANHGGFLFEGYRVDAPAKWRKT